MFSKTFILRDHERGHLVRDGRAGRWLGPGRHRFFFPSDHLHVATVDLDHGLSPWSPELAARSPAAEREITDVPHGPVALVSRDGRPHAARAPGRYVLWTARAALTAQIVDLRPLRPAVPEPFWPLLDPDDAEIVEVHPYQRAVIYADGALVEVLAAGRHLLSKVDRSLDAARVDGREQELPITGQEVMTADKVTLRANLIVKYRVIDAVLAIEATTSLRDALYSEAQIAARQVVAGSRLDELLEQRNGAAAAMRAAITARAGDWGVEVLALDLKDVVLPGEMKAILNQVIEAEKRAAANVITRREETAATRSLANTAKLMDQNPTLLRLRELEILKEIAGEVGEIRVIAGGDLLGRLSLSS